MEFDILIMKSGKRKRTEEIELLIQESTRILGDKRKFQVLGIMEVDNNKQREIKEKKKIIP